MTFARVAPREWDQDLAVEFLRDLGAAYGDDFFQMDLVRIHRLHYFQSAAYKEKMGALFNDAHDAVLKKYGFPQGVVGLRDGLVAVCQYTKEPGVRAALTLLHDAVFGHTDNFVDTQPITAKCIAKVCRMQVETFVSEEFQDELRSARARGPESKRGPVTWRQTNAIDQLTLGAQREILNECGLSGTEAGRHSFFQVVAQHIMHPIIAAYTMAVNIVVRDDEEACKRFVEKLEDILLSDPMPKRTNSKLQALVEAQKEAQKLEAQKLARRLGGRSNTRRPAGPCTSLKADPSLPARIRRLGAAGVRLLPSCTVKCAIC